MPFGAFEHGEEAEGSFYFSAWPRGGFAEGFRVARQARRCSSLMVRMHPRFGMAREGRFSGRLMRSSVSPGRVIAADAFAASAGLPGSLMGHACGVALGVVPSCW